LKNNKNLRLPLEGDITFYPKTQIICYIVVLKVLKTSTKYTLFRLIQNNCVDGYIKSVSLVKCKWDEIVDLSSAPLTSVHKHFKVYDSFDFVS